VTDTLDKHRHIDQGEPSHPEPTRRQHRTSSRQNHGPRAIPVANAHASGPSSNAAPLSLTQVTKTKAGPVKQQPTTTASSSTVQVGTKLLYNPVTYFTCSLSFIVLPCSQQLR